MRVCCENITIVIKFCRMNYKDLISQSWDYTQQNKKLIKWFGFLPAIFTTTVTTGYILYQIFAFKASYLFSEKEHNFLGEVAKIIFGFFKTNSSLTIPFIIVAAIFAVIYFLLPTLCKASAIQFIARQKSQQKVTLSLALKHGFLSFLPLFEYHLLIKTFSLFSILVEMGFVLRNLGVGLFQIFMPVFLMLIVLSFVLTLLFTYSDFFIVIDSEGVFASIKKSVKLVIMHWKYTFLMTILMLIIGVRIIIQVIVVFLIPFFVVLIMGYLAAAALPITGIVVGSVVGLIALFVASYLNGVVDVFSYVVWTFTFIELTSKKEVSAREVFTDTPAKCGTEASHLFERRG